MRELVLPSYAKLIGPGKVEINADEAYPELLEELAMGIDQYTVAVARECAKMDVQMALAGTSASPEQGGALTILITGDSNKWRLANLPKQKITSKEDGKSVTVEKGEFEATKGREARTHYNRIRNFQL